MQRNIIFFHVEGSGGSRREMYEFAKQFIKNGYEIQTYTTSLSDDWHLPMNEFGDEKIYRLKKATYIKISGITGFSKVICDTKFIKETETIEKKIAKDIEKQNPRFVFVHHSQPIQSPFLLKYLKSVPSVYFCAEPMRRFYEKSIIRPYQNKRLLSRLLDLWYYPVTQIYYNKIKNEDKNNIRHAKVIVTNSNYTRKYIKSAYSVNALTCHLGVDIDKFSDNFGSKRSNFFLSVGAVAPLKGYDLLIKAVKKLPPKLKYPIVIIGNTVSQSESFYLKSLAKENSVKLKIYENLSDNELTSFYRKTRLLLYSPHREPMGFAPLEAMACGTPVVAVGEAGPTETVKHDSTGFLTERNPDSFSKHIEKALEPKTWKRLSKNCRSYIEGYWTWAKAYQRLADILRKEELI